MRGNRTDLLPSAIEDLSVPVMESYQPLPGLAPPGGYLLFIVNHDGVPSEGTYVMLSLEEED